METTLVFWDFVWIAIIVIVFGGGSAYVTKRTGNEEKLNHILEKLDRLNNKNGER